MNIIVTVLIVIVSIVVLFLIIAVFTKKSYSLEREIKINRASNDVFNFIKNLKNQDLFNKWVMADPNMKKEYRGTDGTIGFVYAWDGNKRAGKGEQEIKDIKEGERLDVEVRFIKPFAGIASTPFAVRSLSDNESSVTWGMKSTVRYPMNLMLLFMNMDKALGKDLEVSLNALKRILEVK
jgi:Ca2+/Na+ antiporter